MAGMAKASVLLGVCVTFSGTAWSQSVARVGQDRVSVHATAMPIGRVLSELSVFQALDSLLIDPAVASRPVTVAIDGLAPADAVVVVLRESGLNYAVSGGRVIVGNPLAAVPARDVLAAGSPVADGKALVIGVSGLPVETPADSTPSALPQTPPPAGASVGDAGASPASPMASSEDPAAEMSIDPAAREALVTAETPEYSMSWENTTYKDPNFVPYKLTEAARRARMSVDVTTIP
jgi:hypothetical protein